MVSSESPLPTAAEPLDVPFHKTDGIYLLSHSVGLLPQSVSLSPFLTSWQEEGSDAWPNWLEEVSRFRRAVAQLLHTEPEWICPQSNVSSGLSKVLAALPNRTGRDEILLDPAGFPSLSYVAERSRYKRRLGGKPTDRTELILLTHVLSNSGEKLPIRELAQEAKAKGCYVAVDIAQSAGIVPIDLREWEVDFVLGSCVKWLCGGPGSGFLWVNPEIVEQCQPLDVGWFSHEEPFAFDPEDFRYAPNASRFWGGTPSILPFSLAAQSIELLLSTGIERIAAHNKLLTDLLIDGFQLSPPKERGGTITLPATEENCTLLKNLHVRHDRRGHAIRLSPHLYNSKEELELLLSKV